MRCLDFGSYKVYKRDIWDGQNSPIYRGVLISGVLIRGVTLQLFLTVESSPVLNLLSGRVGWRIVVQFHQLRQEIVHYLCHQYFGGGGGIMNEEMIIELQINNLHN